MAKSKIKELLDGLPAKSQLIAGQLSDELAFMQKTLKVLKKSIEDNGAVDMTTGAPKESPAVKSYNQMVKNYSCVLKQLEKMTRTENGNIKGEDALKSWLEASK